MVFCEDLKIRSFSYLLFSGPSSESDSEQRQAVVEALRKLDETGDLNLSKLPLEETVLAKIARVLVAHEKAVIQLDLSSQGEDAEQISLLILIDSDIDY